MNHYVPPTGGDDSSGWTTPSKTLHGDEMRGSALNVCVLARERAGLQSDMLHSYMGLEVREGGTSE